MASLTGNKIKDTYQSLLKTNDNGQVTSVSKNITDGFGSGSGLYLKDTGVTLSGSVLLAGISQSPQANVLTYDSASGQIYYTASSAISGGGSGIPGGSDTEIQFNSGSTFSGSAAFRFIYASQSLEQGQNVQAIGAYSHAEGGYTQAIGINSHAEGWTAIASGSYSHAEGGGLAVGTGSHAEGGGSAIGDYSHAEGSSTIAIGGGSHAEGSITTTQGAWSHAEGFGTIASSSYSHAEGNSTQAIGEASHAEGQETKAIGIASHAEGNSTKTGTQNAYSASIVNGIVTMSAQYPDISANFPTNVRLYIYDELFDNVYNRSVLLISQSYYNSPNTIIELYDTSGTSAKVYIGPLGSNWEGDQTIPSNYSHAEGEFSQTLGNYSHAEGTSTLAIGQYSHAQGESTQAIGILSHAEGTNTVAIGVASHAEGDSTQAIGDYSHAEGLQTVASGSYSHAEGGGTQALGAGSHAEGSGTVAIGECSHTEGQGTVALGNFQSVVGQYNISSSAQSAFIIGNGDWFDTRSNLLFAQGNTVQITGSLDVSGSGRFTNGLNITGNISISGSIIPATDGISTTSSFSLGSATNAWKDIFVSNGTINFLDGAGNVQATLASNEQGLILPEALNFSSSVVQSVSASSGDGLGASTLELKPDTTLGTDQYIVLDPTAPNHIHIRAGGTIDNSSSDLILGGEKNYVRVRDNSPNVRMQTTSIVTLNTYYFNVGVAYSTAVWETVGDVHQITINDPSQSIYDAVWAFNNVSIFSVVDNITNPILQILNSSTPGGPNPIVLTVNLAPPSSPTNLDQLYFDINQERETYIQTDGTDIRMEAADDIRIYSNDIFRLRNYAVDEGIEITTDYDNGNYEWYFGADGKLSMPGALEQGSSVLATGSYSHAQGTTTQAIGEYSHAEGSFTKAIGAGSHAEGSYTVASGSYQHVSGYYNQHNNDLSLFIVGIGLSEETRKDGFTVDVDANGSGSVMIPNNLDAPSVAKTGSMYVDPANNKLWIYTGNGGVGGWVTASLG